MAWPDYLGVKLHQSREMQPREVEGVSHRYGRTGALDDLTLTIPAPRMAGAIRAGRRRATACGRSLLSWPNS